MATLPALRNLARFVLIGLVLALGCVGLSRSAPTAPTGRIAFLGESGELYTISPAGTYQRRLTDDGGLKQSPVWSPDGERLAFITSAIYDDGEYYDDVFVIKRDGGGLGRVTSGVNAYSVAWSPDGTRLLLSLASAKGRDGIAEVLLSERPRARLRRFAGSRERMALKYSPDGGSLAFQERGSIYVALIDGGVLRGVRKVAAGLNARWLGRGSALAILQNGAIRAFPLGGGSPRLLLRGVGNVTAFDLERRGNLLVVDDYVRSGNSDIPRLFIVTLSTGHRRALTMDGQSQEAPSWQQPCTIIGTERPDRIVGTAGNDVICALGGKDVIRAGGGHDTVIGGNGDDTIDGGSGRDYLFGADGRDSIVSRDHSRDVVDGGAGPDSALADGGGIDTVRGIEPTNP